MNTTNRGALQQADETEEPGEVADEADANEDDEQKTVVPNKVHIRGVDTLHTDDIKEYVKKHSGHVERVEWIDDAAANLVFSSELTAREAIAALSAVEIADVTALAIGEAIQAKPLEGRPEISLQVRFAVQGDKKRAGAALRSRYYLLHPEHDPEERRRRQQDSRSRYRSRDGDRRGGGRRRRNSDDEVETFEASMYDDAPVAASSDRLRSYSADNRGKELFAGRGSRRDRSASPRRDRDGDAHMDELRSLSSNNRSNARSIKDRVAKENAGKELFPSKASDKGGQLDHLEKSIGSARLEEEDMSKVVAVPESQSQTSRGAFNIKGAASQQSQMGGGFTIKGAASAKELFPDKLGSGNVGKELLDADHTKRRQKAHDLFS